MSETTENTNGAAEGGQPLESVKTRRTTLARVLPSDRMPFDKQLSVARAYAVAYATNGGNPVTNEEVAKLLGMSPLTVVQTNAFFTDVGLLQRVKDTQGFLPSPELQAYGKAFEWDPQTAGTKLGPLMERSWAGQLLVGRVRFRPHDVREAIGVLADASGAGKEHEDRLMMLLNFLIEACVVARDGNTVKATLPNDAIPPNVAVVPSNPGFDFSSLRPSSPEEDSKLARLFAALRNPAPENHAPDEDQSEFTFVLDAKRGRKVVVRAPHDLTQREITRLHAWLDIQLVVDDPVEAAPSQ